MKKVLLLTGALGFFFLVACAQSEKNVPESVLQAFSKKFENPKKVKWDNEEGEGWEAEFKLNGTEYSATFDDDGNWLETEYEVDYSKVPPIVKATISVEFKDYKVKESEISEKDSGKVYEFELEKNKSVVEATIDMNGKLLNKEGEDEEDED